MTGLKTAAAATHIGPSWMAPDALWDWLGAVSGASALLFWAAAVLLTGPDDSASATGRGSRSPASDVTHRAPEALYGGYVGMPYTHPSNVRFEHADGATDLTVHDVNWDGRPFKSPIYYGLRAIRWGAGGFGGMVDFTHSKAISQRDQVVHFSGTRNRKPAPEPQSIDKTFKHLEFSHGHNMLTLNGMMHLGRLSQALQPYVGLGAGVALPHTEVQFTDEAKRTYEYQYAGPVGQALIGLEFRLPRISLFVEYKFTLARYSAPLSGRDSRGWGLGDFPTQLMSYLRGEKPENGVLTTMLVSHQVIGGVGARQGFPATAAQ